MRLDTEILRYKIAHPGDPVWVVAQNGEIIEWGTGLVHGLINTDFPALMTARHSKQRHFDGMSAEALGDPRTNTPKHVILGKIDIELLRVLRGGNIGYSDELLEGLLKRNKELLSAVISKRNKRLWAEPDSVFNSPESRLRRSRSLSRVYFKKWQDSDFRSVRVRQIRERTCTPENRARVRAQFKALWQDPHYRARIGPRIREGQRKRYNNPGDAQICRAVAKKAWETRRARYGTNGLMNGTWKRVKTPRDKARMGERVRWGYMWKRLPYVLDLLFDSPEHICSICGWGTRKERGLPLHIGKKHGGELRRES